MSDARHPVAGLSREEKARLFEKLRARGAPARTEKAPDAAVEGAIPRLPPGFGPVPLSFSQARLSLVDRLNPGNPVYHIPTALKVRGRFSPAAFAAALSGVVARHEALRTTFPSGERGAVQRIEPAAPVPLPAVDLAACPSGARDAEARRLFVAEAARPFSLARGPLLRALRLALGSSAGVEEQGLLLTLHHIVSDGWSSSILVAEATALYAAAVGGAPPALPPLPIQYRDFSVWQRDFLSGAELERQLAFWRGALAGAPEELPLRHDFARTGVASGRGRAFHFPIAPEIADAVRELARAEGATPFMVLLSAWGVFLAREAGVDDLVVGTSIANRNRAETAGLIGLFANLLPLRIDLRPERPGGAAPSFRELVRRTRRMALGAFAHQDLPFDRLVEELKVRRRPDLSPLFQVLFVFLNTPEARPEAADLSFDGIELPVVTAKFDLGFGVVEQGGTWRATLDYASDLFAQETAERFPRALVERIGALVARPDEAIGTAGGRSLPEAAASTPPLVVVEAGTPFVSPTTPLERELAAIWARLLGVDPVRVGRGSSFFDLGGHSLLAVELALEVERRWKVELSLRALFERPTLEAVAREIAESQKATAGAPSAPAGSATPTGREIPRLAVRPEPLPASFAQSRLWWLDRLARDGEGGETAYNVPTALRLGGALHPTALRTALGAMVARHEALRTTFVATPEGPAQEIRPPGPVPLPQVDLAGLTVSAREPEAKRFLAVEAARRFSLADGPLHFALLIRFAPEEHALLLNLHHIVSDGWSSPILVRETVACYEAALSGRPAALEPLPIQYADFAVWQRARLAGPELESQLAAWRQALSGAPLALRLPLDRPRPPVRDGRGAVLSFELPDAATDRLRELAAAEGATPFMVLLAGWGLFLGRLANVADLVVGTAVANRTRPEVAGLIGFFVNTLALRLRLAPEPEDGGPEPTFRDLVRRARRTTLDAFAHQDLPFERLVEALDPPREPGLSPVFQVLFALQSAQSTGIGALAAPGLRIEPIELPSEVAKFDLSLIWAERQGRFVAAFEYALDLFLPETVARWADGLSDLLGRAFAAPDDPAWRLARFDAPLGQLLGRDETQAPARAPFEPPKTPFEIEAARLWSDVLGVDLARIGRGSTFFDLGGHSLLAAQLATRVERSLGVEISLRALFEHPELSAFAAGLEAVGARLPGAAAPATGSGTGQAATAVTVTASGSRETPSLAARAIPRLDPRPDPLPLSFAQSRLWVLELLEGAGDPTYHIPAPLRVRGRFDVGAMKRALASVVARHEALRTTFAATETGPVQRISPPGPVALPRVDLTSLSGSRREGELLRVLLVEAARPFSLATGPLVRALAVRLADDDHALLLNLHHIVSDGWSSSILVAESAALYAEAKTGLRAPLPPLPIQYPDFAVWQRSYLAGEELARQVGFWREALAGAPPELRLPLDRPRPRTRTTRGGHVAFELSPEVADSLRAFARAERATPFMILLASWALFLGRYAGEEDVVVGTPIANRNRAEIAGLIGFFVNTLAIRLRLSRQAEGEGRDGASGASRGPGSPTFRELVSRSRRAALEAFAHQDLPFERLVEELSPDRNLGASPIFQTLFSFLNTPEPKLEAAGLSLRPIDLPFAPPKFDLSLGLADRQGRIFGAIEYAGDLFDRETIERWSRELAALVGRAMADPDRPARMAAALAEPELRQLLVDWNPPADPRGPDFAGRSFTDRPFPSLPALFRAQAAETPWAVAVRRGAHALTFAELDDASDRLARRLVALGARPETFVGVCLPREIPLVVALLAVLKSGAAYLPLDPAYPPERLAWMLRDAKSRLVIGEEALLSRLATALAARDLEAAAALAALTVVSPEPPAESAPEIEGELGLEIDPSSLAYAIYTSGSTGRPKGVAIAHAQAAAMLAWARREFDAEERSGLLASTSVCFDLSVFEIFLPLTAGGTVLLAENALELPAVTKTARVSLINTVPSAMAELVRQKAIPESVETICLAGEALPGELLAAIFAVSAVARVVNLYGPSEDTTYSTIASFYRPQPEIEPDSPAEAARQATPPIGRAISGGRAYLLDPPAGEEKDAPLDFEPVPPGAVGELYLGGLGVARGYLGRPDLTAERFLPDPFAGVPGARLYRTGDLARFRASGPTAGELLFLGRRDHQIKVRGFRVELGEIESALRASSQVSDVAVVAVPSAAGGPVDRLAAYVVPAPGASPDPGVLRAHLAGRLPEAFQPSFWVLLERLPRSPNGKLDRRALPDPAASAADEPQLDPPSGALEQLAARLWSEVLGIEVERIGRRSSFFSLGGHSLLGAQLATRTERLLQVTLPLRALFEQPTLEGFAAQIAALDSLPGRAEKIARALLRVQAMSGAQKEARRTEEPVGA